MRILVNAGPTREFIDSVRYLSNSSTGKMGFAVAEAAAGRGHQVTLVTGPVTLDTLPGVERVDVVSSEEMLHACLSVFDACDAAILTAAVSDFRPTRTFDHKIRRGEESRTLILESTVDICARLGSMKGKRCVVGFALEDQDELLHAEEKLRRKDCDAIVLNGPGNIGGDHGTIRILTSKGGWRDPVSGSKRELAEQILAMIEEMACARE